MRVIDRIVSSVGRRVDDSSPMVDAQACRTARASTRSFRHWPWMARCCRSADFRQSVCGQNDLVNLSALTQPMLDFLSHCVRARLNILVSGGTGAGKTTLLNVLSSFISERERIVTIEDAAELQLHQEHVARLETRPPNIEGKGAIRQRQLVINALRMRPDRIIVGEVRGEEALDMLQAMNTGHDGSLTTVHANTPRDALARIETMIAMGATNLPGTRDAPADLFGDPGRRSADALERRHAQGDERLARSPAWKATSSPCRRSSCSRKSA